MILKDIVPLFWEDEEPNRMVKFVESVRVSYPDNKETIEQIIEAGEWVLFLSHRNQLERA